MTREELRRQMRKARRALPPEVRRAASIAAAVNLSATRHYQDARRIAVYLAMDGELDPTPLVLRARSDGREVYLPVLPPKDGPMSFRLYVEDTPLTPNRFGILEPVSGDLLAAKDMDLVVTPLVGFDLSGNRMGMGAGFYDRTFDFLNTAMQRHPALIGYGYAMQRMPALTRETWDVPLAGVVTEQQFHPCDSPGN
jgi:5-formyltetrahydrofolate cyclo-ligase